MVTDRYIFDCEVYPYDWVFVFKHKITKEYTVIHNDFEAMVQFLKDHPVLFGGFNNKHYDQFIKKAVLCGMTPEQIKEINDYIVVEGH